MLDLRKVKEIRFK